MTFGPWIQEADYDATGDAVHVGLSNNATDYHSSFAGPTPIDATEFENAWQGAEASSSFVDYGGYAGTTVFANVDGSIFPPYDPTTYDGYHGVDPIFFHVTDTDRYFPSRFTPIVPPGWDGYEWEDGIGWSTVADAILEKIMVNDTISASLSAGTWDHQLYGTTDYTPPLLDGHVPTFDLTTYSKSLEYSQAITGNTSGFYQRTIGHNVLHLTTDVRGSIALVNTLVTSSATMAAVVEGTYTWGSFISSIGDPAYTYLRYQMRPPRYRFFKTSRVAPPRLIYPRPQEGRRIYPPPPTQQAGTRTGTSSPL